MAGKFLSPLRVEEIEDGSHDGRGTWQLLAPLLYLSDVLKGLVTVPLGFVTDFASVPRIPVAFWLAGDCAHAAAVLHDWLYTSHQVDRGTADAVLREAAMVGGVPAWRAWTMWAGVRIGGAGAWRADGQDQPAPVAATLEAVAP
jgi:hypothetical protein